MGTGDPAGVAITHAMTSGMGGLRTAGDLVARVQMSRGIKIDAAKAYVADRLKVSTADLHDPVKMGEVRQDLRLGRLQSHTNEPKGMEAKQNIAEALGIDINSLRASRKRCGP